MTLRVEIDGDKFINLEPCKCPNSYNVDKKVGEQRKESKLKQTLKRIIANRDKITVEPFIFCYMLPSVLAGLAVQNLCLEKACAVNLKYDNVTCLNIMQGKNPNHTKEEEEVQKLVAGMTAWSYPLQTALPGLLILFIGAWSDRTRNRKAFMVLPILGKLVSVIGIILSTYFFMEIPLDETALFEGLPPALTGGRVAMTMAVYSYISDVTSDSERTFRVGIVTAILTLSRPIGLSMSGVLTNKIGYYGVFSISTVFYLIGFCYIVVRLKEKRKKPDEQSKECALFDLFCLKDLVSTVSVGVRRRNGSRRLQIILILMAYMFIVGPVQGEAQMTYWFTRYKFKFTEVDYSLFLTYSVIVGIIGSFITVYLFSKKWKMEDSVIGAVAGISRILASLVYAFAPSRAVYFLGPVLDMFSSAGATALRSIITKLVDSDEIGKAGSLIGISEAIVPVIYSPVYTKVYLTTLSNFPGAFYLISAGLAFPAIFLFMFLYILHKKMDKAAAAESHKDLKDTEKHKETISKEHIDKESSSSNCIESKEDKYDKTIVTNDDGSNIFEKDSTNRDCYCTPSSIIAENSISKDKVVVNVISSTEIINNETGNKVVVNDTESAESVKDSDETNNKCVELVKADKINIVASEITRI